MATAAVAARHTCLSASRFRDLVSAGVFERQPSGKYDLKTIREAYCLQMQKVAAGRGDDGNGALSKQRAKLAEPQTASAVLKTAILSGGYVSIELVVRKLETMFATMKEIAMSTAGKVADAYKPCRNQWQLQRINLIAFQAPKRARPWLQLSPSRRSTRCLLGKANKAESKQFAKGGTMRRSARTSSGHQARQQEAALPSRPASPGRRALLWAAW
jgi:hypothetical protein